VEGPGGSWGANVSTDCSGLASLGLNSCDSCAGGEIHVVSIIMILVDEEIKNGLLSNCTESWF